MYSHTNLTSQQPLAKAFAHCRRANKFSKSGTCPASSLILAYWLSSQTSDLDKGLLSRIAQQTRIKTLTKLVSFLIKKYLDLFDSGTNDWRIPLFALAHSCWRCTWHTRLPLTESSGSVHPSARVFTSRKHRPDNLMLLPVFTSINPLHVSPWNIPSGDAPNRLSDPSGNIPHSSTCSPLSLLKEWTAEDSNLIPLWKFWKFLGGSCFLLIIQFQDSTNYLFPYIPVKAGAFEDVTLPIRSRNQLSVLWGCLSTRSSTYPRGFPHHRVIFRPEFPRRFGSVFFFVRIFYPLDPPTASYPIHIWCIPEFLWW